MDDKILRKIHKNKIIAIIRDVRLDKMLFTVGALLEGGISLLEVTFKHERSASRDETLESLRLITQEFGEDVCLGAGTVLSTEQVADAISCGAQYIISPNTDLSVIKMTKQLGRISIPGAFTPSEMVLAYNSGADVIKLFPAGIFGTIYIKAVLAPLRNIPIIAVGGIDSDNAAEFIQAGAIGVGVGGNLVDEKAILEGDYSKITKAAREFITKVHN